MKVHPASVVAQTPHSAIIYDELVRVYFHLKTGGMKLTHFIRFSQPKPMHEEFQL